MKTKILFFTTFTIILIAAFSCNEEKSEKELQKTTNEFKLKKSKSLNTQTDPCSSERIDKPILPKNTDLTFKIDYKDTTHYQPFQYDLKHGYGIVGKIKMINNTKKIDYIEFNVFEVGSCKYYFIEEATYSNKSKNGKTHEIEFKISEFNKNERRPDKKLDRKDKTFEIEVGHLINIQITSKDYPELDTNHKFDVESTQELITDQVIIFPPFICQGKIIDGNN